MSDWHYSYGHWVRERCCCHREATLLLLENPHCLPNGPIPFSKLIQHPPGPYSGTLKVEAICPSETLEQPFTL